MVLSREDRMLGGLWGAVVGDALGVPVEFKGREARKQDPVTGMRGYGTFRVPPGTWSDDSSLMLCTIESLLSGFDTVHMADLFVRWIDDAYWTPWGKTFDVGGTTLSAIMRIANGTDPELAGGDSEHDNGNGSLMRILPVGIALAGSTPDGIISHAHRASSITHRHPRSLVACGLYCLLVSSLLQGVSIEKAYEEAIKAGLAHYSAEPYSSQLPHFERILSGNIAAVPEELISSGGYVVHTLEASLWCVLTTASFAEAVLKAANLGEDTDTTATVTGGLAGMVYGLNAVPEEWRSAIARRDEIDGLFALFFKSLEGISGKV